MTADLLEDLALAKVQLQSARAEASEGADEADGGAERAAASGEQHGVGARASNGLTPDAARRASSGLDGWSGALGAEGDDAETGEAEDPFASPHTLEKASSLVERLVKSSKRLSQASVTGEKHPV